MKSIANNAITLLLQYLWTGSKGTLDGVRASTTLLREMNERLKRIEERLDTDGK